MSKWMLTMAPSSHKNRLLSNSLEHSSVLFFFYMELVKNLLGQCCFSRRAQLESAQSGTGKAQDRGRLTPPHPLRTSLATFIILVMSQELKDGSALPAVITLLQFAVKTYRSILCCGEE